MNIGYVLLSLLTHANVHSKQVDTIDLSTDEFDMRTDVCSVIKTSAIISMVESISSQFMLNGMEKGRE